MRLLRTSLFSALCLALALVPAVRAAAADEPPTAQQMMSAAEAKANAAHKNLLVDFSASWCGNCRLFDRFWDDPQMHAILSKSFERVTLIIDEHDARHQDTPGAYAVLTQLGGSRNSGIPFLAMATPSGKPIITNEKDGTPKSGIGYPDAPSEIEWFMHMLDKAAPQLSPADRAEIDSWLKAHSTVSSH